MKIKLRVEVLEELQKEENLNDTKLAEKMGISRSRLWRTKLDDNHPKYCSPGESLIIGTLQAFPHKKFEDLFFLTELCSDIHNKGEFRESEVI
ncbi:transcriptional regulator with XRE-family HTH domain [Paenibacillus sp. V4I3]|uniref:winged helix-turn-helix domain-containing protein n=1 Tax=Paenibacillus sp. V4I3 TaxID=3042305 RepID=UPI002789DED4|nr:winged helix-turn-helix domain-containing protein [Paenibacillus sp. V4I3]MDQ0876792.1 transcriptional regulator with XRE-family HTH domain [Paenibacillus sp. V4I3]